MPGAGGDEGLAVEVSDADRGAVRQRVPEGRGHQHRLVEQPDPGQSVERIGCEAMQRSIPGPAGRVPSRRRAAGAVRPRRPGGPLERGGRPPLPHDAGLKDTISLRPDEAAKIITRFDGHRGRYLFHCHNAEHEDVGMMANLEVV